MSYYKTNPFTKSKAVWYNPVTGETANKKLSKDDVYFASLHEFSVYRHLKSFCDYLAPSWQVVTQVYVPIKPDSAKLKSLSWKVDFALQDKEDMHTYCYVEAKGGWIIQNHLYCNEFYQKLHLWDSNYPKEFEKFYLVGDSTLKKQSSCPVPVYELHEILIKLQEDLLV